MLHMSMYLAVDRFLVYLVRGIGPIQRCQIIKNNLPRFVNYIPLHTDSVLSRMGRVTVFIGILCVFFTYLTEYTCIPILSGKLYVR